MATLHPAMSIAKNKNLAIAFSSGIDSIAIAHFCKKWNPTLIHFNHKLRSQNDEMEHQAIEFSKSFGLKLIVKKRVDEFKTSCIEAEARQMRIDAFKCEFNKKVFDYQTDIIVCHHLDDAVENYMWNCMRGHDNHDSIPIKTSIDTNINLIRPFMTTSKSELCQYAIENDLMKFVVEDETNTDQSINRNWIRHGLIPQIKERIGIDSVVKKKVVEQYEKFRA